MKRKAPGGEEATIPRLRRERDELRRLLEKARNDNAELTRKLVTALKDREPE